jgi:mRNA-degrading endonuclease YafQ of YafQ-DinJ toxin-antitoxin module
MNLQKLAEKINERWDGLNAKAVTFPGMKSPAILCHELGSYCVNTEDAQSAHWIIWCLDRLEELGREPELYSRYVGYRDRHIEYEVILVNPVRSGMYKAKTRAEAVTLALAKALGVEDE